MFEHIINGFENMKGFVSGFSVPDEIGALITSGEIDISRDIEDPSALIDQIVHSKEKLGANEFGIGGRWRWNLRQKSIESQAQNEGWLYIQVIGLKKACWTSSEVTIMPQYIKQDGVVDIVEASHTFGYIEKEEERTSTDLLNWLHLSRGIDISESSFSRNNDMIYSDLLIKSESGVFPWTKKDFEDGKPKKSLETLYNMSPWLFPQNFFNDVCIPNEYHRVVACVITRSDLENAGIGIEIVDGKIDDIIGSLRWKLI